MHVDDEGKQQQQQQQQQQQHQRADKHDAAAAAVIIQSALTHRAQAKRNRFVSRVLHGTDGRTDVA